MKKTVFTGAATALVTPMINGGVDYDKFALLVEDQIAKNIDALVVCGTTGESSTLTDEEHRELIKFCVEKTAGRVPVIAGTGGNNTVSAAEMSLFAKKAGADGILSVAPYYNKGTKSGITEHYRTIAEKCRIPVMVYNVPSRTGVSLTPEMYGELSEIP